LTTDDYFRPFFRRESRFLDELLRVGAQAVQELVSEIYPGMRIGLVYTVHTGGRDQVYKPHVHLVITKGVYWLLHSSGLILAENIEFCSS
jgi:hypothetical protein